MISPAERQRLSDILRPVAPPRVLDNVYTDDQFERLLGVVRDHGPWKLILAQHFASVDELLATATGGMPEGVTPSLDMFLSPTFRGFYANHSTALYPEIADIFYNEPFLEQAKRYWNAQYAKPQMMLFNINGPCANFDSGHLDSPSFRGVRYENSPTWLCSVMGKSGLFQDYLIKMAQVITWWSHCPKSGFTYWPDGPLAAPQRLAPPMYNRGVVVQNEMMVHRGEANGPKDQQWPAGLQFNSVFQGDPDSRDHWLLTTDGQVIARHATRDLRFLVHWSAEVFSDFDELKRNMDHTADLSHDQVFDTLIRDVRAKGIEISLPADPFHDPLFIKTLNGAYDIGAPAHYPAEAPISPFRSAA